MHLTGCWNRYLNGFREVVYLARAAKAAPVSIISGGSVSEQQILVRAAIVLLASHVEAFFSEIADDFMDVIDSRSYNTQPPGVQRYVALQAADALLSAIDSVGDGYDEKQRTQFYRRILTASRWMKDPGRVAEASKPRLREFYKQKGVKAIDKYLSLFCSRRIKFFDWLGSIGVDRVRFATVIEGLITARNEIAHGNNGSTSLGVQDLRDYVAITTVMLRRVDQYLD